MKIQNANTTPSKSSQLRNANTVRLGTSPLNHGKLIIGNPKSLRLSSTLLWMSLPITFIFKSKKEVSLSEVFALFDCSSAGYISGIYFSKPGLSMVNISSR